jgi:hypothetical protein
MKITRGKHFSEIILLIHNLFHVKCAGLGLLLMNDSGEHQIKSSDIVK